MNCKIKLVSKLAARRLILEHTGMLRDQPGNDIDALAEALRATRAKYSQT